MNKAQILAEIRLKIAGQGSAVDAGSALPGILSSITNLIPDEPGGDEPLVVEDISFMTNSQVEGLKIGDLVIAGAEDKKLYVVADVVDDVDKIKRLVNVDRRTVRTVSYTYNDDPEMGEIGWGEGNGQTITIPDSPTIDFPSLSDVDRFLSAGKIVLIGDAGEYEAYTVTTSTPEAMELTSVTADIIKTANYVADGGGYPVYNGTVTTTLTPDA